MPSTRPAGQPEPASPETRPSGPYWDAVYQRRGASGVSWFQAEPQTSVDLIRARATPHTPIIDAGAGAGSLTGQLAAAGFTDLTAVDISAAALQAARQRLAGHPAACRIRWIHADLLTRQPDRRYLRGWYPIGGSGFKTQLIHKEWPEARPRKKPDLIADRRRGSFDLVVLAPSQLQRTALEQFIVGRINAPIVIELGLNYGKHHLTGDRHKLANSEVQHPYLVHLSRMPSSRQGATEDIIAGIRERPKIAYFHHDLEVKEVSYRYLGSPDITKYPPR